MRWLGRTWLRALARGQAAAAVARRRSRAAAAAMCSAMTSSRRAGRSALGRWRPAHQRPRRIAGGGAAACRPAVRLRQRAFRARQGARARGASAYEDVLHGRRQPVYAAVRRDRCPRGSTSTCIRPRSRCDFASRASCTRRYGMRSKAPWRYRLPVRRPPFPIFRGMQTVGGAAAAAFSGSTVAAAGAVTCAVATCLAAGARSLRRRGAARLASACATGCDDAARSGHPCNAGDRPAGNRRVAARPRAGAARGHLHPGRERPGTGHRRHACGARARRLRAVSKPPGASVASRASSC